jgi:3-hydroxyacyl-CoA dehydrogenase
VISPTRGDALRYRKLGKSPITVKKLSCNHPIGPSALADPIGLDALLSIMQILHDHFANSKYRPCPLLKEMVAAAIECPGTGDRIMPKTMKARSCMASSSR